MADPEKAMEVVNNDDSGEEEEVDGSDIKANVAAELLKNPALFSALQGKLNNMVGMNSGYIAVIIFQFFSRWHPTSFRQKFQTLTKREKNREILFCRSCFNLTNFFTKIFKILISLRFEIFIKTCWDTLWF